MEIKWEDYIYSAKYGYEEEYDFEVGVLILYQIEWHGEIRTYMRLVGDCNEQLGLCDCCSMKRDSGFKILKVSYDLVDKIKQIKIPQI